MTLNKAITLLQAEYEKAKNNNYIKNPLAYALYSVWQESNKTSINTKENNNELSNSTTTLL